MGRFNSKITQRSNGKGDFGKEQLKALRELLLSERVQACTKKIICFHHHLYREEDQDDNQETFDSLQEVIKGMGVDALLYGHKHNGKEDKKWSKKLSIHRCYDGSSSTGKKTVIKQKIIQRVIDLYKEINSDYNAKLHKD